MATKNIFCAQCQEVTAHDLGVESMNGEILATCSCGRFLKFPPDVTPESFAELLAAHQEANTGQVSLEATEKLVATLADDDTKAAPAAPVQPEASAEVAQAPRA